MDYPAKVFDTRTLDAVFLTHAHLDHAGGLPFFEHYHMRCPIFCTKETRDITKILLKDSWKISHLRHKCEPYRKMDLKSVMKDIRLQRFDAEQRFRTIKYEFLNAGHIPGSASIKFSIEGKTVLYTGDYNTVETLLMQQADPASWGHVDVLITESTYGVRNHPDRNKLRRDILHKIESVVGRGGSVLLPVFAVGRAQEVLLMLSGKKWDIPIYMDGMAKKVTRIAMRGSSPYTKHKDELAAMYRKIKVIHNSHQRENAANGPGIFITTSGMMSGGPAMRYMENIWNDPKSAVLLTGFQVKNTNGYRLAEERTWFVNGKRESVKCDVVRYDFSAHLSREDIQDAIRATQPGTVIFNHGSPEALAAMADWARKETDANIFVPGVGDLIELDGETLQKRVYTDDDGYDFPHEHQHGETCQPSDYTVEYDE